MAGVNAIPGMDDLNAVSKAGWSTDDGQTAYCVPTTAVLHGFIYNQDAFRSFTWAASMTACIRTCHAGGAPWLVPGPA